MLRTFQSLFDHNREALKLEWHPEQAGVARSLDLGYSTGPFKLTDTTRDVPAHRPRSPA